MSPEGAFETLRFVTVLCVGLLISVGTGACARDASATVQPPVEEQSALVSNAAAEPLAEYGVIRTTAEEVGTTLSVRVWTEVPLRSALPGVGALCEAERAYEGTASLIVLDVISTDDDGTGVELVLQWNPAAEGPLVLGQGEYFGPGDLTALIMRLSHPGRDAVGYGYRLGFHSDATPATLESYVASSATAPEWMTREVVFPEQSVRLGKHLKARGQAAARRSAQ